MGIVDEEWRPVAGEFLHCKYLVSNKGRVKSLHHTPARVLRMWSDKDGYKRTHLRSVRSVRKHTQVHRIVAMAFVDGYQPGLQVNHKNGIKDDNRPENLEWVTGQENIRHAWATGLMTCEMAGGGPNRRRRRLTPEQAAGIRTLRGRGVKRSFLARWFNVGAHTISQITSGRTYRA